MSFCNMASTVLSTSYIYSRLILTTTMYTLYWYYPHFKDEKVDGWKDGWMDEFHYSVFQISLIIEITWVLIKN